MRILIIDQCSAAKEVPDWFEPFTADEIDASSLNELIEQNDTPTFPARDLYQGRQQTHISNAIDRLRSVGDTVDRFFVSSGFGLVIEDKLLPPYDVTFAEMSDTAIDDRATNLRIQEDLFALFEDGPDYDIVFLPLGKDYYRSFDLEDVIKSLPSSTITVLFNQQSVADVSENVISIPARNGEAREQGEIVIGLKGKYLGNFARCREIGREVDTPRDVIECTSEEPTE